MKISIYVPYAKEHFETAHQHLIFNFASWTNGRQAGMHAEAAECCGTPLLQSLF
jgi:hypothetical protein